MWHVQGKSCRQAGRHTCSCRALCSLSRSATFASAAACASRAIRSCCRHDSSAACAEAFGPQPLGESPLIIKRSLPVLQELCKTSPVQIRRFTALYHAAYGPQSIRLLAFVCNKCSCRLSTSCLKLATAASCCRLSPVRAAS